MIDTKKLDKALLKAICIAQAVVEDRFDAQSSAGYASAEAVFQEGREALAHAGLVLVPKEFERVNFGGLECLVRIVDLLHVKSGQQREYASAPFPFCADGTSPALAVGGLATLSLRYIVRDILLLPVEEPGASFSPTPLVQPTCEREAVRDRMLARSRFPREAREQTEAEVLGDIEALLLSAPDGAVELARKEIVGADIVRLRATRDALLSYGTPPRLEPNGDIDTSSECLKIGCSSRSHNLSDTLCDGHATGRINSHGATVASANFSVMTTRVIEQLGVKTLAELSRLSPSDITKVKGSGRITVNEIMVKLSSVGIGLTHDAPTPMEVAVGRLPDLVPETPVEKVGDSVGDAGGAGDCAPGNPSEDRVECPACSGVLPCSVSGPCGGSRFLPAGMTTVAEVLNSRQVDYDERMAKRERSQVSGSIVEEPKESSVLDGYYDDDDPVLGF